MIGIQADKAGYAVVACVESRLELIGTGKELQELIGMARAQAGVDAASAAVAVPAWYNDAQRIDIRDQLLEAGISNVRLVDEPVAIALAFGHAQAAMPERPLVMSVSNLGAFDVTLLIWRGTHYEVLAANGIPQLGPEQIADADRLFAAIEPVVNRALADAETKVEDLDAIILGAASAVLWPAAAQIETAWGRKPVEPLTPEIAMANGAAIYDRMSPASAPAPTAANPSASKSGCLSLLIVAVLVGFIPFLFA